MKMSICAVLLGAARAAAFATVGGACVDVKPALFKDALVKNLQAKVAELAEEEQMQVVESAKKVKSNKEPLGTCEALKAADGCEVMMTECCATCGDVIQSETFIVSIGLGVPFLAGLIAGGGLGYYFGGRRLEETPSK